jgi:NADPH:quinone reductase-like Zn-dependent oxidoreductase
MAPQVNLHTALGLLMDIDPVQSGHYILQNGANSGVSEFISHTHADLYERSGKPSSK